MTLTLTVLVSAAVIGMDAYAFLLARISGGWIEDYAYACAAFAWWMESSVSILQYCRDRF
jgi:hypothetical protein